MILTIDPNSWDIKVGLCDFQHFLNHLIYVYTLGGEPSNPNDQMGYNLLAIDPNFLPGTSSRKCWDLETANPKPLLALNYEVSFGSPKKTC